MERAALHRASTLSSPTRDLADELKRKWRIKDTAVFPNPLPSLAKEAPPIKSIDTLVHTGRLEFRKGTHILLHAITRLSQTNPTLKLLLIGAPYGKASDGTDYGTYLKTLIDKYGLNNRVEWIKGLSRDALLKKLSEASIAVYPAVWDNFPYAALEAMSLGLPVIAASVGGFPEFIRHGQDGLLFEPNSAEACSKAILTLVNNPTMASQIAQSGQERVNTLCDPERIAERTEDLYKRALHG